MGRETPGTAQRLPRLADTRPVDALRRRPDRRVERGRSRAPRGALFALLLLPGLAAAEASPRVVTGALRPSAAELAGGAVRLDGEWRFAPGVLIAPDAPPDAFGDGLTTVPGAWEERVTLAEQPARHGFASYALEIELPERSGPLALRLSTVGTAYRLYVDGVLVAGAGRVATSARDASPEYRPRVVPLPPQPDRHLRLLLHVSNFHYAKGGLWEPLWIGAPDTLRAHREGRVGLSMFLAGAFLLLGLYHLIVWGARRSDRSPLWFAALCFGMAVRGLTVDDVYLADLLPWNISKTA